MIMNEMAETVDRLPTGGLKKVRRKRRKTNRTTNTTNTTCASSSRTLALEQAYVHDVYSAIASNPHLTTTTTSPVRSHVKEFIFEEFEPGSLLLDIGCSDGKYLHLSPDVIVIGLEHCAEWFASYEDNDDGHLLLADILHLPFRDEMFDGVLCCSVLHHLSTLERRIRALKEITRILKIGGKLLLTVTRGPSHEMKDIESQDVLIKVNDLVKSEEAANFSESDIDSTSFSSTTTTSTSSSNKSNLIDHNVYHDTNHSPTSSELENCYSFVKKALKRFSLTSSSGYSMRNSSISDSSSKSRLSGLQEEIYPIELRNLDEDEFSLCSSKSSSTTGDSALSSFNRSSGCISQTSSNNLFPSSFMSAIKEHLASWRVHFTNSFENWQLIEGRATNETLASSSLNHRFSLPISFRKANTNKPEAGKNLLGKNSKVYAFNGFENSVIQNFFAKYESKNVELNLLETINGRRASYSRKRGSIQEDALIVSSTTDKDSTDNFTVFNNKIIYQKSFSSESSRKASVQCSDYKLIAYYSMPELRTLFSGPESMKSENIHPITFLVKPKPSEDLGQDQNCNYQLKLIDSNLILLSGKETTPKVKPTPSPEPTSSSDVDSSIAEEMQDKPTTMPEPDKGRFPKKLLRQRSFSADYQPETVKFQPELPRRFSASPNIGTHRYNNNSHTPHQQQISIDSEESFITIIPANRSARDSIVDTVNIGESLTDYEIEDEYNTEDILSPNGTYESYSSEDEDACCENLFGEEQQTSNDTSVSSVLEATVKSVESKDSNDDLSDELIEEISHNSATPSPPINLHRYYHLFRRNELDQLIENHVQNLHIIDSHYSECAMSWCLVAERIHVWTI